MGIPFTLDEDSYTEARWQIFADGGSYRHRRKDAGGGDVAVGRKQMRNWDITNKAPIQEMVAVFSH